MSERTIESVEQELHDAKVILDIMSESPVSFAEEISETKEAILDLTSELKKLKKKRSGCGCGGR